MAAHDGYISLTPLHTDMTAHHVPRFARAPADLADLEARHSFKLLQPSISIPRSGGSRQRARPTA
ncbi:MAG: hypothetical protein MZV70_52935 [Desulfobacterales bacterium]|nr:hypothetical protein [Desulfobacterales bacterium]